MEIIANKCTTRPLFSAKAPPSGRKPFSKTAAGRQGQTSSRLKIARKSAASKGLRGIPMSKMPAPIRGDPPPRRNQKMRPEMHKFNDLTHKNAKPRSCRASSSPNMPESAEAKPKMSSNRIKKINSYKINIKIKFNNQHNTLSTPPTPKAKILIRAAKITFRPASSHQTYLPSPLQTYPHTPILTNRPPTPRPSLR